MTRIISFCCICFMMISNGCRKYNTEANTSIQGTWELRSSSGSFQTNYAAGNGRTLTFSGDHYEMKENGQVTRSGQFGIISDNTAASSTCLFISSDQYTNRIIYDNNSNATKFFFQISGDTLRIISGCFAVDAGSLYEYARL